MTEPSDSQDQIVCPACETPADPHAVVCAVCGAVLAEGIESDQTTELLQRLRDALQGRYVLGTAIGLGRAGITVRARRQSGSNRDVAIKIAWNDPIARRDVVRETDLAAQVVHPSVLPIVRLDVPPPLVAVEMPLVEGGTLGDLIDGGKPVPYGRVVDIVRAVGGALDEAHSRGIIHGALRPEKIHLDRDGNALISGFMLGQFPSPDRDAPMPNTIGAPAYTAFEQRHNLHTIDGRADQFSLAVICYELLSGKRTWRIPSDGVLEIDAIEILPHRAIAPSVPLSAGAAIKRATWKDPSYRYDTVADFVAGLTGTALEGTPTEQLARVERGPVKRRSPLWILAPLAALVVLAASLRPGMRNTAVHWWQAAFSDLNSLTTKNDDGGPSIDVSTVPVSGTESKQSVRGAVGKRPANTSVGESTQYRAVSPNRAIDPYPKGTSLPTSTEVQNTRRIEQQRPAGLSARVPEPIGVGEAKPGGRVSSDNAGTVSSRPDTKPKAGEHRVPSGRDASGTQQQGDTSTRGVIAVSVKSGETADVYVDGQRRGRTPLVWQTSLGAHIVSLRGGKVYAPLTMSVVVTRHDTVRAVFSPSASLPRE